MAVIRIVHLWTDQSNKLAPVPDNYRYRRLDMFYKKLTLLSFSWNTSLNLKFILHEKAIVHFTEKGTLSCYCCASTNLNDPLIRTNLQKVHLSKTSEKARQSSHIETLDMT